MESSVVEVDMMRLVIVSQGADKGLSTVVGDTREMEVSLRCRKDIEIV